MVEEVRRGKAVLRQAGDRGGHGGGQDRLVPLRDLWPLLDHPPDPESLLTCGPMASTLLAMAWQGAERSPAGTSWTLLQLAHLLHREPTPEQRLSLWLALAGQQDLFRLRRDGITSRRADELKRMRQQRRQQRRRQQGRDDFLQAVRQRQAWSAPSGSREALELRRLVDLTRQGDDLSLWADCPDDLRHALGQARCDGSPQALRSLLVDLGHWAADLPLALSRSVWAGGFPQACLEEAEALIRGADGEHPGDRERLDLTGLHSISIDDPGTREIDDALALERCDDGTAVIWVHVADPHRLITPGSAIDDEARRRGTTLYLSGGLQPMLPLVLGAGPLSLSSGGRRAAVSLALTLDADGNLCQARLVRSWIRVAYSLSYADADELIELAPPEDPDLACLDGMLRTRRDWRTRCGALAMDQPEGRIRRGEAGPELVITEPGPSRALVAEAMILAGAAAAAWAATADVAMPFRCQDGHSSLSPEQLLALPEGPVRWAHQRLGLARSRLQPRPGPHRSLGLEAYLQWTSPIRRYGDLLAHRQWLAATGALALPPLTADQLLPELDQADRLAREAQLVSREDQRLALQHWLEVSPPAAPVRCQLLRWLRQDHGLGLVRIDDWGMELAADVESGAAPGDVLQLSLVAVSSRHDRLELRARRR